MERIGGCAQGQMSQEGCGNLGEGYVPSVPGFTPSLRGRCIPTAKCSLSPLHPVPERPQPTPSGFRPRAARGPTYNLRLGANGNVERLEETQYDRHEPLSQ